MQDSWSRWRHSKELWLRDEKHLDGWPRGAIEGMQLGPLSYQAFEARNYACRMRWGIQIWKDKNACCDSFLHTVYDPYEPIHAFLVRADYYIHRNSTKIGNLCTFLIQIRTHFDDVKRSSCRLELFSGLSASTSGIRVFRLSFAHIQKGTLSTDATEISN